MHHASMMLHAPTLPSNYRYFIAAMPSKKLHSAGELSRAERALRGVKEGDEVRKRVGWSS
jgi:hypothetical protein